MIINVTATNTTAWSYLTLWPSGTEPNTSNLNWTSSNQTIANRIIVQLSVTGTINISNAFGSTDVIVDISGYFTGPTSTTGGTSYTAINPIRILDTRPNSGYIGQGINLLSGASLSLQISGVNGVPITTTAAAINVTVTDTNAGGYLSITPTNSVSTSDVNWTNSGQSVANIDIATLSSSGSIVITNGSPMSVDVVVDLLGYFN